MATYVLVHGAWHGGWCWRRLVPLLREAGHTVHTPTLTGLGERAHLATPEIDLLLHARDVLGLLEYEGVREAVLLGHSYGGMVISQVAEQAAERLAHLVYLDAFVPRHGEAMFQLLPPERRRLYEESAGSGPDAWRIPAPPPELWGLSDPADLDWVRPLLCPQPRQTFARPLDAPADRAATLPRTYVRAAAYQGPFGPFAERARREQGWRYHEIDSGHDVMVSRPRELADILLNLT